MDLDPNLTESQGNVTQPQWDVGPRKSDDGYKGSNEHFGVNYNVIKIKKTDAVLGNAPSEEQRQLSVNERGIFSQYKQQENEDKIYQSWMRKIGPYLADWVLHLPRHENPPWKLMKFPEHYTLWIHESGVITDRGNPRTDAYLYGAPPLGPRTSRAQTTSAIFRSPTEFVPHAIWLMRGSTGQCDCKYCIPGQNQIDINRRLNHGVDADSEDDDDGDDNAASSSRRRARTRRVRRDRSPPININAARDYRVGATDPDPSPSSTE
ncbi:hypothetical protein V8E52_006315 [Russula decolorans]